VYLSEAHHARNAVAFEQESQNHLGFFDGQVHAVKRVVACVREHLAALGTLVALAVLALAKLPALGPAIVTGHFEPCFLQSEVSKWLWVPTQP